MLRRNKTHKDHLRLIKIDGVAEPFFFHVIYHRHHQHFAEMIAEGHIKDFGKPE